MVKPFILYCLLLWLTSSFVTTAYYLGPFPVRASQVFSIPYYRGPFPSIPYYWDVVGLARVLQNSLINE